MGSAIGLPAARPRWRSLLIVAGTLVAGGGVGLVSPMLGPELFLATFGGFIALLLWRMDFVSLVGVTACVAAASYRGALYASQVPIAGIVFNYLDLLWLLVIARFLVRSVSGWRPPPVAHAPLAIALLSLLVGLLWGQPLYNVARLFRVELLLAAGTYIGLGLTVPERLTVLRGIVLGGTITAIAQVATFLFALGGMNIWTRLGISASNSTDFRIFDASSTSSYRDTGVVIDFAVYGLIGLLACAMNQVRLFGRTLSYAAATLCLAAIVLSLTRADWAVTVVGVGICLLLSSRNAANVRSRYILQFALVGIVVTGIVLTTSSERVLTIVEDRFLSFQNGSDHNTLGARALESGGALSIIRESWLVGVGAANVSYAELGQDGLLIVREVNQLHNGYLQITLGGGLIGLGLLFWVLVSALLAARRQAIASSDAGISSTGRTAFVILLSTGVLALTSGVLNDAQQTGIIGLLVGMALREQPDSMLAPSKTRHSVPPPGPRGGLSDE